MSVRRAGHHGTYHTRSRPEHGTGLAEAGFAAGARCWGGKRRWERVQSIVPNVCILGAVLQHQRPRCTATLGNVKVRDGDSCGVMIRRCFEVCHGSVLSSASRVLDVECHLQHSGGQRRFVDHRGCSVLEEKREVEGQAEGVVPPPAHLKGRVRRRQPKPKRSTGCTRLRSIGSCGMTAARTTDHV